MRSSDFFVRHLYARFLLEPRRYRKALFAQELRVEQFRLIARSIIGENRDDGVPRPQLLGKPDRARDIDAGRAAHAQTLVLEQIEDDWNRLLVGYLIGDVDRRILQVLGDATLADAFGDGRTLRLEHAMGVVAVERRAHRIGERDADVLVARLERHGDAGQRAAGADRAGEAVHLAVGLIPDLRSGGLDVALAVGDVVELVGPDRAVGLGARQLLGKAPGHLHVVVRIRVGDGRHLDQLGAAEPQHVLLFLALGVRDDDHGAEAERVADQREPDAGVAGGPFHDHAAGRQRALADGILDDEQRGPILHRLARIHELGFTKDRASGGCGRALELDQWRVADGGDDSFANLHVPAGLHPTKVGNLDDGDPDDKHAVDRAILI